MKVTCSDCGGIFDSSEAKCPYCGMIYEPGAEKEYNDKLESIRKNLDNVDDIVVTEIKTELKYFLKMFLISLVVVLTIAAMVISSRKRIEVQKEAKTVRELNDRIDRLIRFDSNASTWNELYDAGMYDEMYELVNSQRRDYIPDISYWSHYDFFCTYGYYYEAKKNCELVSSEDSYNANELSAALYNLLSLNSALHVDMYKKLSYKDKEFLENCYDELEKETKTLFEISDEEFVKIEEILCHNNSVYISSYECDAFAEERLGKKQ